MTINTDFSINPASFGATRVAERSDAPSPAATKAAGESFSVALASAGTGAASAKASAVKTETIRPLVKHEAREVAPLEQFEGFVLRSFVESMLPSDASEFFGKGTAGAIWRSMLAEEIGAEMAKGGGIGIADAISKKENPTAGAHARAEATAGIAALQAQEDASEAATIATPKAVR
ncbi:rod-binding protein [Jiella mangrovi]|uniref:Rod-binding protein n=1 Tax=Jiella mangrovi TaxID=2821407 RepID=A0ABS4BKG7_9HYPH|nr:rod-binding protein [Jiella mangrovi]MBP0616654.1 rod-binding protein [Jiella mangrovi]